MDSFQLFLLQWKHKKLNIEEEEWRRITLSNKSKNTLQLALTN